MGDLKRNLLNTLTILIITGCAGSTLDGDINEIRGGEDGPAVGQDYLTHDEASDLEPVFVTKSNRITGIPTSFNKNRVVDDAFFTAVDAVTVAQVQAFLENTPYNRRCFLADERVNGKSAAQAIVDASRAKGINPIMMISRMQVEKSLIAKTSRPSSKSVDYAFGCGCPDNRACNPAYRGLDKQIECAANTLRRHFDKSAAGNGIWNKGVAKRSLDPTTVTPENHATASLYAYTPWVLQGRGGNWLAWNIALRFARHFAEMGVDLPGGDGDLGGNPGDGGDGGNQTRPGWVGDACEPGGNEAICGFNRNGVDGFCQPASPTSGICSLPCEGYCPDQSGRTSTFCVDGSLFGGFGSGVCTVYASSANNNCQALGLVARDTERYIGNSSARQRTSRVCVPATPPSPAAPEPQEPRDPQDPEPQDPAPQDPEPQDPEPQDPEPQEPRDPQDPGPQDPRVPGQADDPGQGGCGEVPAEGMCQNNVAVRCAGNRRIITQCDTYGQTCTMGPAGAACRPEERPVSYDDDRCGVSLDFEGACEGGVAVWCSEGHVYAFDCGWRGQGCGFGNDGNGYWCR